MSFTNNSNFCYFLLLTWYQSTSLRVSLSVSVLFVYWVSNSTDLFIKRNSDQSSGKIISLVFCSFLTLEETAKMVFVIIVTTNVFLYNPEFVFSNNLPHRENAFAHMKGWICAECLNLNSCKFWETCGVIQYTGPKNPSRPKWKTMVQKLCSGCTPAQLRLVIDQIRWFKWFGQVWSSTQPESPKFLT